MTLTDSFCVSVTFCGEEYLFKNVYRMEYVFVDGAFRLIIRYKPHLRYLSEYFTVKDIDVLQFYRKEEGVIVNDR